MDININTTLSLLLKAYLYPAYGEMNSIQSWKNTRSIPCTSPTDLKRTTEWEPQCLPTSFKKCSSYLILAVFTAGATGIFQAYDIINKNKINKSIILSDSLSTLISIKNIYQPNSMFRKIQNQISLLKTNAKTISRFWILNYVGVQGNELADAYAK